MGDATSLVLDITFIYKDRQWSAKVKKQIQEGKTRYLVEYHPARNASLEGRVEICPPGKNSGHSFWKQYRRSVDEIQLQPEFINYLGMEISRWEMGQPGR